MTRWTEAELRARFGPSFIARNDPKFLEGLNRRALVEALVAGLTCAAEAAPHSDLGSTGQDSADVLSGVHEQVFSVECHEKTDKGSVQMQPAVFVNSTRRTSTESVECAGARDGSDCQENVSHPASGYYEGRTSHMKAKSNKGNQGQSAIG